MRMECYLINLIKSPGNVGVEGIGETTLSLLRGKSSIPNGENKPTRRQGQELSCRFFMNDSKSRLTLIAVSQGAIRVFPG